MASLSLIVPVYNGINDLEKCLQSIFTQTVEEMEVILIDDGSADESFEYIKSWISRNDTKGYNIQLKRQKNSGVSITRNTGIGMATGEYIMFADCDDYFDRDYCKVYLSTAEKKNADIVVGGYERVGDNEKLIKRVSLDNAPFSKYVVVSPWAHIYRREFLINNNILFLNSPIGEDIYFNLLAYSHANHVEIISNTGYKWYFNISSVSNSKQNTINRNINPGILLDRIYTDIKNKDFREDTLTEYFFLRYICWYMLFFPLGAVKKGI